MSGHAHRPIFLNLRPAGYDNMSESKQFTGVLRSKMTVERQRGAVISLNGLCGSGKSAFIDWVERNFGKSIGDTKRDTNARRIFGHTAIDNRKFDDSYAMGAILRGNLYVYKETPSVIVRENFYANPPDWAWYFQNVQQRKCLEFMIEAQHYAQYEGAICWIDRDLYGNACFELKHSETGVIPPELHATYKTLNDSIFAEFSPDVTLLLDAPVEVCYERLEMRRKTSHESIPDCNYLRELRVAHDKILGYGDDSVIQYHRDGEKNTRRYGLKLVRHCPTMKSVGDLEAFHAQTLLMVADEIDKMRQESTGRKSLLAST